MRRHRASDEGTPEPPRGAIRSRLVDEFSPPTLCRDGGEPPPPPPKEGPGPPTPWRPCARDAPPPSPALSRVCFLWAGPSPVLLAGCLPPPTKNAAPLLAWSAAPVKVRLFPAVFRPSEESGSEEGWAAVAGLPVPLCRPVVRVWWVLLPVPAVWINSIQLTPPQVPWGT